MTIEPNGNVSQLPGTNGLVKAMLLVNANGSINLCYNSQLTGFAATTPLCGFNVNHPSTGVFDIQFPFQVNVRFFSVSPAFDNGNTNFSGLPFESGVRPIAPDTVRVQVGTDTANVDVPFYLIVF